jgi:hypothetical protein
MLEWLRHVMRMDETAVAKKVFKGKPEGRRKLRTAIMRCSEAAENDIRELKLKRWRLKANNGEQRTSIVKATTALRGLKSQGVSE